MLNVHVRALPISPEKAGELIDGLASDGDLLWPKQDWPPMRLDGRLGVGVKGGHGPVRYEVTEYVPGKKIKFRFNATRGLCVGLEGDHFFEILPGKSKHAVIAHTIEATMHGRMKFIWTELLEPLHDALIEDAFDRAQAFATGAEIAPRWTTRTKLLRKLVRLASK